MGIDLKSWAGFLRKKTKLFWAKYVYRKFMPGKPIYPFDLLLAPLPGKCRELPYGNFPGMHNLAKDNKYLFLYPSRRLKPLIYCVGVLPTFFLFFVAPFWVAFVYFLSFFIAYRFCYLYWRKPVLSTLLHQWPQFSKNFIREIPQQEYRGKGLDWLKGPRKLRKFYREPVNWSDNSQQECFLVLAMLDLLKGNEKKSSFLERSTVKFVFYGYFPVWCSCLLLLFLVFCSFFIPTNSPEYRYYFKFLVFAGIGWAIMALLYCIKMKFFLEKFQMTHHPHNLRSRMRRWLPLNIKEEPSLVSTLNVTPSLLLTSSKIISLIELAFISLFLWLLQIVISIGTLLDS